MLLYDTTTIQMNTMRIVYVLFLFCLCMVFQTTHIHASHSTQSTIQGIPDSFFANRDIQALMNLWGRINRPWKTWPGIGFCRNSTSLVHGISDNICHRRLCLYSHSQKVFVDLKKLKNVHWIPDQPKIDIEEVRWMGDVRQCHRPNGGQLPLSIDSEGKRKRIEVSFLYTLHNNAALTTTAMLEVFRTANEASSAEFVVIDDGSTEDMSPVHNLLKSLEYFFQIPITTRTHNSSVGYLYSNNEGMQIANGEYVVLLNSDVLVLPGWLKMLLRTMHNFPSGKVGMVGSMMVDRNGEIMEAGGGVFRYGQPFNMGRGFLPSDLPLQHARVVDYISAACLLVRRKLFLSLGLFDQKYAPAYFEDTDAALVHEEHGWKTILQPLSVVVHYEGASYGKSGKSNVKDNLMEANFKKFSESHKALVENYCPSPRYDLPLHTTSRLDVHMGHSFYRQPNRVLYLEDIVPEPDRDAGSIRLAAMLHILTELGMSVTFESQPVVERDVRYLLSLFADGVNAVVPGTLRDMALSALALRTVSADAQFYSTLNLCPYDLVIIARRDIFTRNIADVKTLCPHVPIVFDTVDVHFIRELRMFNVSHESSTPTIPSKHDKKKGKSRKDSSSSNQDELNHIYQGRDLELGHMKMSNITLVVSSEEQRILKELLGPQADVRVISNIYKVDDDSKSSADADHHGTTPPGDESAPKPQRSGAVFVGNMCHHPNIDAVDFIVNQILNSQYSKENFPKDFKMHFVWSRTSMCPNKVLQQAERNPMVVVHRDISDDELYALHQRVKVVLAPLRYGAGVKGKVNYALLHGVPVIATKIAAEGMGLIHETNCLLAETGEDFARAIIRVSGNDTLFQTIAVGGKDVMRKLFGRDVARDKLKQLLQDLKVMNSQLSPVTPISNNKTSVNIIPHYPAVCQNIREFDTQQHNIGSFWRSESIASYLPPHPEQTPWKSNAKERAKDNARQQVMQEKIEKASHKKHPPRKEVRRKDLLLHDQGVTFPVYPRLSFTGEYLKNKK